MSFMAGPFHLVNFGLFNGISRDPDHHMYQAFSENGMLWFQNFCEHDPLFILPLLTSVLQFLNIKLSMGEYDPDPIFKAKKEM
jgi:membrane protein insertase Oxa1/YidC/SpoIIIJ